MSLPGGDETGNLLEHAETRGVHTTVLVRLRPGGYSYSYRQRYTNPQSPLPYVPVFVFTHIFKF